MWHKGSECPSKQIPARIQEDEQANTTVGNPAECVNSESTGIDLRGLYTVTVGHCNEIKVGEDEFRDVKLRRWRPFTRQWLQSTQGSAVKDIVMHMHKHDPRHTPTRLTLTDIHTLH